eukprot:GSMAST32.ASY1.ANO1.1158.1 assembled CDS
MLVKTMNAWVVVLNIANALFVVSAINSCPLGTYVTEDAQGCALCPEGRYGDVLTNKDKECSGVCDEGYFCPPGSTSPKQQYCSSESLSSSSARFYCSKGRRNLVSPGHYTWPDCSCDLNVATYTGVIQNASSLLDGFEVSTLVDNITTTNEAQKIFHSDEGMPQWLSFDFHAANPTLPYADTRLRSEQRPCEPGYFCIGPGTKGIRRKCPEGTYGISTELKDDLCSGVCEAGTYCPAGTISPLPCPKGYYCPDGHAKYPCPPGRYGSLCDKGYYCPSKSTNSKQIKCPVGFYGDTLGLTSELCSGECLDGYYCSDDQDNVSPTPSATKCRNAKEYCPKGSASPILVDAGYYTLGGSDDGSGRTHQLICPKGTYCIDGIKIDCAPGVYGLEEGLAQDTCSDRCPSGYYCPAGTINPTANASCGHVSFYCPAGSESPNNSQPGYYTVGGTPITRHAQRICPMGYWCNTGVKQLCSAGYFGSSEGLSTKQCSGICPAGYFCYWCGRGSTSPTENSCGSANVYCPKGSGSPQKASEGYYTFPLSGSPSQANIANRVMQNICVKGNYCTGGIKYTCPPGTYGSIEGLSTSKCSGLCPMGHYCPEETTVPIPCPQGVYGNTQGLKTSACSSRCNPRQKCNLGTINPNST